MGIFWWFYEKKLKAKKKLEILFIKFELKILCLTWKVNRLTKGSGLKIDGEHEVGD